MRTLGNLLWVVLVGWWLAIAYVAAGILACLAIITIPFGLQAFKLAAFAVWPFGRVVVPRLDADPELDAVGNLLWLVVGIPLAIAHVVAGFILCVTVIGLPLGLACFKMIPLCLMPFGKEIVPAYTLPPGTTSYDFF
jgi:uncharacterized membrane protein YccF (DUF307 family)